VPDVIIREAYVSIHLAGAASYASGQGKLIAECAVAMPSVVPDSLPEKEGFEQHEDEACRKQPTEGAR